MLLKLRVVVDKDTVEFFEGSGITAINKTYVGQVCDKLIVKRNDKVIAIFTRWDYYQIIDESKKKYSYELLIGLLTQAKTWLKETSGDVGVDMSQALLRVENVLRAIEDVQSGEAVLAAKEFSKEMKDKALEQYEKKLGIDD